MSKYKHMSGMSGYMSESMYGSVSEPGHMSMSRSESIYNPSIDCGTATHRTFISMHPHHISAGILESYSGDAIDIAPERSLAKGILFIHSPARPAPRPRAPGAFISTHRIPPHARGRLLTRVRDRPLAVSIRVRRSRSRLPFLFRRLRRA